MNQTWINATGFLYVLTHLALYICMFHALLLFMPVYKAGSCTSCSENNDLYRLLYLPPAQLFESNLQLTPHLNK